jgi:superoxide reductase
MKDRRNFIKCGILAGSALALTSVSNAVASSVPATTYNNIVYTKDNPGQWAKKVGGHLPSITIDGGKVTVFTKHGMSEKHFIVRHTLVLEDGTVVGAKVFHPSDKEAKSSYDLPAGYKGKLFATSFCNLHDFWVNEATV